MTTTKKYSSKKTTEYDKNPKIEEKRLYRSETNRILAGICSGLSDFFSVDPTLIRIIFIVLSVFGGSGILIYLLLWIIIPSQGSKDAGLTNDDLRKNAMEIGQKAKDIGDNLGKSVENKSSKQLFGLILLGIGGMFLLSNFGFFRMVDFEKIWPIILVGIGLAILFKKA